MLNITITREMQIKTTTRIIHWNACNQEDWPYQGLGRILGDWNSCALLVGTQSVQPLWKTVLQFIKKHILTI